MVVPGTVVVVDSGTVVVVVSPGVVVSVVVVVAGTVVVGTVVSGTVVVVSGTVVVVVGSVGGAAVGAGAVVAVTPIGTVTSTGAAGESSMVLPSTSMTRPGGSSARASSTGGVVVDVTAMAPPTPTPTAAFSVSMSVLAMPGSESSGGGGADETISGVGGTAAPEVAFAVAAAALDEAPPEPPLAASVPLGQPVVGPVGVKLLALDDENDDALEAPAFAEPVAVEDDEMPAAVDEVDAAGAAEPALAVLDAVVDDVEAVLWDAGWLAWL